MTVGFSAVSYVSTETEGHVNICVDVLNPAAEGALRPFTVGLLPEPGMPIYVNAVCKNLCIPLYCQHASSHFSLY